MSNPIEMNRALWDAWAAVHGQDAYYDTAGLIAGADSLGDAERAAWVGSLAALLYEMHPAVLRAWRSSLGQS